MRTAGIDPGLTGGIVCIDTIAMTIEAAPLPTYATPKASGGEKNFVSARLLDQLIEHLRLDAVIIEDVHSQPTDGHVGAFSFGMGVGVIHGVVSANDLPITLISPSVWKPALGCTKDKNLTKRVGHRLFPQAVSILTSSGRVEAALIALYGLLNGPTIVNTAHLVPIITPKSVYKILDASRSNRNQP